jgi:cytidine deaminase
MKEIDLKISYTMYEQFSELSDQDLSLIQQAKTALDDSYSPYSNFKVAAVILLENGATVTGTNQENAAYPAGICAEGTALGVASSLHPNVPIQKIAITVKSGHQPIKYPVAPCGICRQRLLEYEQRFEKDIEVILTGQTELTYRVKSVKDLLPLYFSDKDL